LLQLPDTFLVQPQILIYIGMIAACLIVDTLAQVNCLKTAAVSETQIEQRGKDVLL